MKLDNYEKFDALLKILLSIDKERVCQTKYDLKLCEKMINQVEYILQLELPYSFKKFLKMYGDVEIDNFGFIISDSLRITLDWRKDTWPYPSADPFPLSMVAIEDGDAMGDGSVFGIDTARMNKNNECPVVAFPCPDPDGYGLMEKVGDDFISFVTETAYYYAAFIICIDEQEISQYRPNIETACWLFDEELLNASREEIRQSKLEASQEKARGYK